MKTKILLSVLALGLIVSSFGQNTLELTFTAIDSTAYVQLDSIKVMNRTQGGDTVLYYPDTVLVLDYQVGISETNIGTNGFQVFQNYPNPVIDQTIISFYIPERDKVSLIATDMLGRTLIMAERFLDQGYHSYRFTPGNGSLILFTVQWRESSSNIKILRTNSVLKKTRGLEYIGSEDSSPHLKSTKDIMGFLFSLGDKLLYIGYYDTLQSGILDKPQESGNNTFQFAYNIPCPGTPTVEYEGQTYNTVQIMSQCWLKENLNIGTMIPSDSSMNDDGVINKYCINNTLDSCAKYGGLYQWNEMMQYTVQQGTQGICPQGWHLATHEEWKVLEGVADIEFGVGNPEWDTIGAYRGFNAGYNLKSMSGWFLQGNGSDIYGFSGLSCVSPSYFGIWWTSTGYDVNSALDHYLHYSYPSINSSASNKSYGSSVRCVKDN